jgi:hypothetical protein
VASRPINVTITGDYNDRDVKRAIRDLDSMKTQSGSTSAAFGYLKAAAAGAGIAAAVMAGKFAFDGVQAFIEDEAAAAKLEKTLQNLGLAHDKEKVKAYIDELQRTTGVVDDELRPAYSRLVTSLKNSDGAMTALELAMDISAGTGKSLDTVVSALGKAYDGNIGALTRLGIGLTKAEIKTGDMDVITRTLSERFEGQAATAATTYQGQIARVGVAFGELKESFGAGFLAGLSGAEGGVGDLALTLKEFEPTMKDIGETIGKTATSTLELVKMAIDANKAFEDWKTSSGALGEVVTIILEPLKLITGGINSVKDAAVAAQAAIARLMGSQNDGRVLAQIAVNAGDGNAPRPEYGSQVPAGARANGGPVLSGKTYLVGERGPELFTAPSSGTIIPNGGSAPRSSGGNTYNITVQAGVGDPRAIGQQVVEYVRKFEQANGAVFAAA